MSATQTTPLFDINQLNEYWSDWSKKAFVKNSKGYWDHAPGALRFGQYVMNKYPDNWPKHWDDLHNEQDPHKAYDRLCTLIYLDDHLHAP